MRITIYILLFSLFLPFTAKSQDTLSLSLKQCIEFAIKNNIDLIRNESQLQISHEELNQSRASNLPNLNGYLSQGQNSGKSINPYTNTFLNQQIMTGQYGLNSSMTLWNGFYNYNTMRQNSFNFKATKLDNEQAKLDLTINVMTLYYQTLSNEEVLNETILQYNLSKKQVDRLLVLNNNNAVSPNVLYDAKGQLANDKINLINAKNTLETSKLSLIQLLNIDNMIKIKLEKTELPISTSVNNPETIYQTSLQNFPSVRASEYRKISSKKGYNANLGSILPTLSLNASVGTNYSNAASIQKYNYVSDASSDNYVIIGNTKVPVYSPQYSFNEEKINFSDQFKNNLNSYIGLNLQVPIFNSFRQKAQIKISKINYELSGSQNKTNLIKLKINIQQAYLNMLTAQEKYDAVQEQAINYSESFKIAITKFDKGAITSVDYVFSKTNNDKAKLNLVMSKYDYFLKSKVLEYYQGEVKY